MRSDDGCRALSAALQVEIAVLVEARDSLPSDSHLRTLCDLTMEQLQIFVVASQDVHAQHLAVPQ